MRRPVQLLDTSVVLELLEVPGCHDPSLGIAEEFENRALDGVQFHLPVAAVVEAGSHVGRVNEGHGRRVAAFRLEAMIEKTLDRRAPWTFNPMTWDVALLRRLVQPQHSAVLHLAESLARQFLEMGDLLILGEFRRLRENLDRHVVELDVWTLDESLRAVVAALRAEQGY